jgi:diaminohydroxyphosphoribosylaminopyrimidine deaminase/5-amino-6-(5-phosphoribosylamino)uracil reductase
VLVEGGGRLVGSLMDADQVDELHAFIAPKVVGGREAPTPVAGRGLEEMGQAARLGQMSFRQSGDDLYVWGRVRRKQEG